MSFFRLSFFILLVFLISLVVVYDTDFGWHMRVGEFIYNTQSIPRVDLFSYTLPDYKYVYHSWLSELFIFLAFKTFGFWGVSVLYALVATIGVYFMILSSRIISGGKINDIVILLSAGLTTFIATGRIRSIAILFLAVIFYIFLNFLYKRKNILWILPPIFLVWVNLHGSFILGAGSLVLFAFGAYFFGFGNLIRKNAVGLSVVYLLSVLATLINPYFWDAWIQAFKMTSLSSFYIYYINPDWAPLFWARSGPKLFIATGLIGVSIYLLFFAKKKNVFLNFTFIIYFFLSMVLARFLVGLVVVLVPLLNKSAVDYLAGLPKKIVESYIVKASYVVLAVVLLLLSLVNVLTGAEAYKSVDSYIDYVSGYSKGLFPQSKLVKFVSENYSDKRIFNDANSPSSFLFLNGDMKFFYWPAMDNYWHDGKSFVLEYSEIANMRGDWQEKLDSWEIEVVYLKPSYALVSGLRLLDDWEITYEDKEAVVFVKKT